MTIKEVAEKLYVQQETVRRWVRTGRLPANTIGGTFEIEPEDLDVFLGSNPKYDALFNATTLENKEVARLLRRLRRIDIKLLKLEDSAAELRDEYVCLYDELRMFLIGE